MFLTLALGLGDARAWQQCVNSSGLHVRGVDPQVRPVLLDQVVEERAHALIELFAQPADLAWLLDTPVIPRALISSSTDRVEMPCTFAS